MWTNNWTLALVVMYRLEAVTVDISKVTLHLLHTRATDPSTPVTHLTVQLLLLHTVPLLTDLEAMVDHLHLMVLLDLLMAHQVMPRNRMVSLRLQLTVDQVMAHNRMVLLKLLHMVDRLMVQLRLPLTVEPPTELLQLLLTAELMELHKLMDHMVHLLMVSLLLLLTGLMSRQLPITQHQPMALPSLMETCRRTAVQLT